MLNLDQRSADPELLLFNNHLLPASDGLMFCPDSVLCLKPVETLPIRRSQLVHVNNESSATANVYRGVAQGSVLGAIPLYFTHAPSRSYNHDSQLSMEPDQATQLLKLQACLKDISYSLTWIKLKLLHKTPEEHSLY